VRKRYDLVVAAMLVIGVIGLALDMCFAGSETPHRFDGEFAMSLKRKIPLFRDWMAGADFGAARLSECELGRRPELVSVSGEVED
jgi:hypothetical protein